MKILDKIITYGLYLFIFLLPWQTRWIYQEGLLNGGAWEYGRLSLYGTEILLIFLFLLSFAQFIILRNKEQTKLPPVGRHGKTQNSKFWLWVGLLAVWSAVTILWSADRQLAWYGWLRLIEGIGLVWLMTQNPKLKIQNLGMFLIASGVIQSLLAIWQWVVQWSFGNKWLGMAYTNPDTLGTIVIDNGDGRFLRAYGSLPHPNVLAGFLVICILAAIILYIQRQKNKWLLAAITVLSMGLFLTFSRAGWLALFICLFIYFIASLVKLAKLKKLLLSILLIGIIFGSLTYFYSDLVKVRLTSSERIELKSNQERIESLSQVKSIIEQYWFTGVGLNNYTLTLYKRFPFYGSWVYQPVHNSGFLTLAELGIIGLLLFILVIISALKLKSKYWFLIIALLILGFFDHYFSSFYFGIMLWWLVIGLNFLSRVE